LNAYIKEINIEDFYTILSSIRDKQEEFIQELLLKEILNAQVSVFQDFFRRIAVFRLPVLQRGIELVCEEVDNWQEALDKAVRLSLVEQDTTHKDYRYWVTPLLREEVFNQLDDDKKIEVHKRAVRYYQKITDDAAEYSPILSAELIEHALKSCMYDIAIDEAGAKLLPYLRESLAYKEAQSYGEYIRSHISKPRKDEYFARFIYELGWIYHDMGEYKKAIKYYEEALSIDEAVFGRRHPKVAIRLNNLGGAWEALGEYDKAIEYYEEALSIDEEVYGRRHPDVATDLNNLGLAWRALGENKKAIEYYEEALAIWKDVYGQKHPHVAASLNNLGLAWDALGEYDKAIKYYEEALAIDEEVFGRRHPNVATRLNNLGGAWRALGENKKAIEYYEEALAIWKEVYGQKHPHVAASLNNLGLAWDALGEYDKAIKYYEEALAIDEAVFDRRHPDVARDLNNLGGAWRALGEYKKAIKYYEEAYSIFNEFFGPAHPHTKIVKKNLDTLKQSNSGLNSNSGFQPEKEK
jgi:tetratricopeptide (TPR) repeat protein